MLYFLCQSSQKEQHESSYEHMFITHLLNSQPMIWSLIHLWPGTQKLSTARSGCRGDNHWATKVLGHSLATSQKTSGDTHSSHGPGMKPPCRRLSQSTALRLTFSSSGLGFEENETRGHFWQVREGQQKGRRSCHNSPSEEQHCTLCPSFRFYQIMPQC